MNNSGHKVGSFLELTDGNLLFILDKSRLDHPGGRFIYKIFYPKTKICYWVYENTLNDRKKEEKRYKVLDYLYGVM